MLSSQHRKTCLHELSLPSNGKGAPGVLQQRMTAGSTVYHSCNLVGGGGGVGAGKVGSRPNLLRAKMRRSELIPPECRATTAQCSEPVPEYSAQTQSTAYSALSCATSGLLRTPSRHQLVRCDPKSLRPERFPSRTCSALRVAPVPWQISGSISSAASRSRLMEFTSSDCWS